MEEVETKGCLFESIDLYMMNMTTSASLKGSLASIGQKDSAQEKQKILNVLSANLNKHQSSIHLIEPFPLTTSTDFTLSPYNARQKYNDIKNRFMNSEAYKAELKERILQCEVNEGSCMQCEVLRRDHENTRLALQDAIQLTSILLKGVYKQTSAHTNLL